MTIAAVVIISALIGGLSGATIVVIYDQSARKRVLEKLRLIAEKHQDKQER